MSRIFRRPPKLSPAVQAGSMDESETSFWRVRLATIGSALDQRVGITTPVETLAFYKTKEERVLCLDAIMLAMESSGLFCKSLPAGRSDRNKQARHR
jgi:hypothetical protein